MMLSDKTIREKCAEGNLSIERYKDFDKQLQPASFDFQLGYEFKKIANNRSGKAYSTIINLRDEDNNNEHPDLQWISTNFHRSPRDYQIIQPNEFMLGTTVEKFEVPNDLVANVEGKSTFGRVGLIIHATAGFIDPGFKGTITLEMYNFGQNPIALYPGELIGQITFQKLDKACEKPYGDEQGSNYQGQIGVTEPVLRGK